MISKPLQDIVEADLQALISSRREEGPQIDFKRDLPKEDHDGRKEFYSDICAFANTSGGDLVYGMLERDGAAAELVPQVLPASVDGYVLKLQSSIRDMIEPMVQGVGIHPVTLASGGHALVIRVPRSFAGMHRYKKDGNFYVRKSRSNAPLDVPGIISKVADYLGREDRVKSFFARRYADILSNEHSIPLAPGPKLVVHLVPVRDFLDGAEVGVDAAEKDRVIPLLANTGGYTARNTYEGRAFYDAHEGSAVCFTLLMRSGVVEACMDLTPPFWPEDAKRVSLGFVEESVLKFLAAFQDASLADITTQRPFIVRVALLGTNGLPFESGARYDIRHSNYGLPVKQPQPVLLLPDLLIDAPDADVVDLMHGPFLRMWQAWGYSKSFFYERKDERWHRPLQ